MTTLMLKPGLGRFEIKESKQQKIWCPLLANCPANPEGEYSSFLTAALPLPETWARIFWHLPPQGS
jgi:hypothetical protein